MKLVLAAVGLFVTLMGAGIACGPKEKFCYLEGKTCREVGNERDAEANQSDASDAAEASKTCFDNNGNPCDGGQ